MKSLSIEEWLDDEKISMLLSDKEIKRVTADYYEFCEMFEEDYMDCDESYCDLPEFEINTSLPFAKRYFDDIILDIEFDSLEDYIKSYAESVLKTYILCACQMVYEFPLWKGENWLEFQKQLENVLEDLEECSKNIGEYFGFAKFYPYYSNEYVAYPGYMIYWISGVIDEFLYLQNKHMYDYSPQRFNPDGSEKSIQEMMDDAEIEREKRKDPFIKFAEEFLRK